MAYTSIKKEEFSIKILHDLKPSIIAQIVALESFLTTAGDKISQEEKDLIELTLNSCSHIQKLTDTFTFLQESNTGVLKINCEKFDIVELINDSIKQVNVLLKYSELNVSFKEDNKIIVYLDKVQIKKVIDNLLLNSINSAFKNTLIEIRLEIVKDKLFFKIKNNSPYINKNSINKIFEKHKNSMHLFEKSAFELFLYFSKKVIRAHNGEMFFESSIDDINVFGFYVPLK